MYLLWAVVAVFSSVGDYLKDGIEDKKRKEHAEEQIGQSTGRSSISIMNPVYNITSMSQRTTMILSGLTGELAIFNGKYKLRSDRRINGSPLFTMTSTDLHEADGDGDGGGDDRTDRSSRRSFDFQRTRTGTAFLYRSSEDSDLDLESGAGQADGRPSVDALSQGGVWKVTTNEKEMEKDGDSGVLKSTSPMELPSLCEWLEYSGRPQRWRSSDLVVIDPTMAVPDAIKLKGKCILNGAPDSFTTTDTPTHLPTLTTTAH